MTFAWTALTIRCLSPGPGPGRGPGPFGAPSAGWQQHQQQPRDASSAQRFHGGPAAKPACETQRSPGADRSDRGPRKPMAAQRSGSNGLQPACQPLPHPSIPARRSFSPLWLCLPFPSSHPVTYLPIPSSQHHLSANALRTLRTLRRGLPQLPSRLAAQQEITASPPVGITWPKLTMHLKPSKWRSSFGAVYRHT
ncbi:hypothetical protein GRF29_8g477179 [Pseudopithomyces chartarum]|uniref:Uncharacterized protein n=1 Tax=Pseudopithomyces chartarum TaxID=1892770 RepID=A0AAN6RKZ0_9PLEO|nr:hypothetical protein GRF29_8g477179 [Pseudopithomyces chartarum]